MPRSQRSLLRPPKPRSNSPTSTRRLTNNTRTSQSNERHSQTVAVSSIRHASPSRTLSASSTSAKTKPLREPSSRYPLPSNPYSRNSFPSAQDVLSSTADPMAHKKTMTVKTRQAHNQPGERDRRLRNTSVSALPYRSIRNTMSSRRSASCLVVRSRSAPWH